MSKLGSPRKRNRMPLENHYVLDTFRVNETENPGCVKDDPLMRKTRNRTMKLVAILGGEGGRTQILQRSEITDREILIFIQLFCNTCPSLDIKSSNEGRGRRAENSDVVGRICDIFNGVTREYMLIRVEVNNRPIKSMQYRQFL